MTYEIHLAPMMGITDEYYRTLIRLMSPSMVLTTEMVPMSALMHNDHLKQIRHASSHQPLTLQVGGSKIREFEMLSNYLKNSHYTQINVNAGCPSKAVCAGGFGISLFREPQLLASIVKTLKDTCNIPVSVKTRIGVDNSSEHCLMRLVELLVRQDVDILVMHARKALLKGYNPKQNRAIPKIQYQPIHTLKKYFHTLQIIVNGEINTIKDIQHFHTLGYRGVMIGRALAQKPTMALAIEKYLHPQYKIPSPRKIISEYLNLYNYSVDHNCLKPLAMLAKGFPGAKNIRHSLLGIKTADTTKNQLEINISRLEKELASMPDFVETDYSTSPVVANFIEQPPREQSRLDYHSSY